MSDIKVYTPETIDDAPFPVEQTESFVTSQEKSSETYTPQTIKDQPMPKKVVAQELLSTSLNTKSRKILQAYEFAQSGAIQIGKHVEGVSGDLRLTPEGLTARNIAGETTIAIDAETGDATFRGTVQAGDIVIADENGLNSASVFQTEGYFASDTVTKTSGFASTDITGSELNFTLVRATRVLITMFANVSMTFIDSFRGYYVDVWIELDGVDVSGTARFENAGVADSSSGITLGTALSIARVIEVSSGAHQLKMRWLAFSDHTVEIKSRGYQYCMLGS